MMWRMSGSINSTAAFFKSSTLTSCLRLRIADYSSRLFQPQENCFMYMVPTVTTSRIGPGIIGMLGPTKDRMGSYIPVIHRLSGKGNSRVTHMHTPARVLMHLLVPACFSVRCLEIQLLVSGL